jgi:hypothetical protein
LGDHTSRVVARQASADKRALLNNITQDATNVADWNRIAVNQPRTAGIDLNFKF